MPKWPSIFLVAMTASVLTLLGTSLVPGEGSHAAQPLPCGITVDNPCPPLLKVTTPSQRPQMTLSRGKYLVWLEGHGTIRQLNHGLYTLSGCLLYRDEYTRDKALVLDPFSNANPVPTEDLDDYSEMQEVVEKLRKDHKSLFSSEPDATLPINLGEIHFRFPYQPVLVEVPAPTKGGVQPPTVQTPTGTPQLPTAVLSATCRVRIEKSPRALDVKNARIYALRLEAQPSG